MQGKKMERNNEMYPFGAEQIQKSINNCKIQQKELPSNSNE
jgi:hypothetical protein